MRPCRLLPTLSEFIRLYGRIQCRTVDARVLEKLFSQQKTADLHAFVSRSGFAQISGHANWISATNQRHAQIISIPHRIVGRTHPGDGWRILCRLDVRPKEDKELSAEERASIPSGWR